MILLGISWPEEGMPRFEADVSETAVLRPADESELRRALKVAAGVEFDSPPERDEAGRLGFPATRGLLLYILNRVRSSPRFDDGFFAASSLRQSADTLVRAGRLVAAGRVLPGLVRDSGGIWHARWIPAGVPFDSALNVLSDAILRLSCTTRLTEAQARQERFYSAHDAWFAALRSQDDVVRYDSDSDLAALSAELVVWRRPIDGATGNPPPISLLPPASPEGLWSLQIDLSAFLPPVRRSLGEGGSALRLPPSSLRLPLPAYLWLGRAALLAPELDAARFAGDDRLTLSLKNEEAERFLVDSAPILAAAGFPVEIPESLREGHESAVALQAVVAPVEGREGAFDVRWSAVVGGESVSAAELESLLAQGGGLIYFRGRWVRAQRTSLCAARRAVRAKPTRLSDERAAMGLVFGGQRRNGLPVVQVETQGRFRALVERLSSGDVATVDGLAPPAELHGELRPYQLRGMAWMHFLRQCGFGGCLADDMGLGKTVQTLALLLKEREEGARGPVLIVAPTSVLTNWCRETERFAPSLRMLLHQGDSRDHGVSFARAARAVDVVFTGYPLLVRDFRDLNRVSWRGIVLDEAQNIKNADSAQAEHARALEAEWRFALTGTPVENGPEDIRSIMDFLNPGMVADRAAFRDRFTRPIALENDPAAKRALHRLVAPFLLRRLKTDPEIAADLPEKIETRVCCPLTAEQEMLYRDEVESFADDSVAGAAPGRVFALLTHLKQICDHPSVFLHDEDGGVARSGKLLRLVEMLEECFAAGESALVFTQFAETAKLLQAALTAHFGEEMPLLYGGMNRSARDAAAARFAESSVPLAFVLSLKAGGTGLNLVRATQVFHYDRWWNPAVENQATDRAHRIGQTKRVSVHKFICAGTLEERIDRLLGEKSALAELIVARGDRALASLSSAELLKLLRG